MDAIWDDRNAHLGHLPNHILFDLARNGAADRDYRRFAVELLLNRKSPYAKHEELRELVRELEVELDGIQFEFPAPSGPRPMTASVTTATMFSNGPLVENQSLTVEKQLEPQAEVEKEPAPEAPKTVEKSEPTGDPNGG